MKGQGKNWISDIIILADGDYTFWNRVFCDIVEILCKAKQAPAIFAVPHSILIYVALSIRLKSAMCLIGIIFIGVFPDNDSCCERNDEEMSVKELMPRYCVLLSPVSV